MNRNQGKGSSRRGKMVPIQLNDGTLASVNLSDISPDKWIHCHGVAKSTGVQVNSLTISNVGKSTIIKDDTGFGASFDRNELEVAAARLLTERGYTVTYQANS